MTTILLARVASMLVVAASGTLQPGRVAGRALTVGDQHSWSVDAEEGHYIHVVVDQHGIDVVASVLDPAGQTAATVDTPNGDLGPEHVRFVARVRGPYRIDLKAAQPEAERGRYTIHLIERRPATANDRRIVAAIVEQTEADRLRANPATRQESLERYDRAMAIWRDAGDRAGEAGALRAKGFAYVRLRDDGHAYETFSRTRAMWRELGDLRSEAFALLILGTIHTRKDEPLETRARASEALPLWRRAGDREEQAFTLGEIGTTYARLKDRPGTEAWYRDALGVARKSHRRTLEAAILDNFARAYGQLDDQPAALETHERARVKWQQARHRRGQAGSLRSIGAIHEALGETAKAIEAYMKAADLWRQAGVLQEETVDRARADKLRR